MTPENKARVAEQEPIVGDCGKCGHPVSLSLDARLYESLINHTPELFLLGGPRHLLPTKKGCPGSPSRAQYIQGQPRDTRGYPYDKKLETMYQDAYSRIQELTCGGTVPLTFELVRVAVRGIEQIQQMNRASEDSSQE